MKRKDRYTCPSSRARDDDVNLPGREADVRENDQQSSDRLKLPVSTSMSHVPSSEERSRGDTDGVGDEMGSS